MWKWISAGLFVALLATNAWWFYGAIDRGVTDKYRDQVEGERMRKISVLLALTGELVRGYDKQQLIALVQKTNPDSNPVEKEGAIHFSWYSFSLDDDGKVRRIVEGGTTTRFVYR